MTRRLVQRFRESLFFIPAFVVVAGAVFSRVTVWVDQREAAESIPLVIDATVVGARSILSTVAGATVTIAAIVFAMTSLSIQIASSQYSPRVLSGFFRDRFQQWVIGLVIGTFTFSLLALGGLGASDPVEPASQRSLSATVATALGVATAVAIVGSIDHSTRRMRVDEIIRRIADSTVAAVRRVHVQDDDERGRKEGEDPLRAGGRPEGEPMRVAVEATGWVQQIDAARLAASLPADSIVSVEVRVGEAVSAGDIVASVWPMPDPPDEVETAVRRAIQTGRYRTVDQDPAFGLRQLADIGLRALSPGVNDPTTASDVIQLLKVPLREILVRPSPRRVFHGAGTSRVLLPEAYSRSGHVHLAFGEIRLAAIRQPQVLTTLIDVCVDLIRSLVADDLGGRASALVEEATTAVDQAEHSGLRDIDLATVREAGKRLDDAAAAV